MLPTRAQVELAAYHRWLRRGGEHGHDRDDWRAAESDLRFHWNYEIIVRHELSGGPARDPESRAPGTCRFCEQSTPAVTFHVYPPAIPAALGNTALVACDECDACHAQFQETLEKPFEVFYQALLANPEATAAAGIPVPAFKALVKMGLSILPLESVPSFEQTIEWVCNPNHRQDFGTLQGLQCRVLVRPASAPAPWAALARRIDDQELTPFMLFILAAPEIIFQLPLPLATLDDENDKEPSTLPEIPFEHDPSDRRESRTLEMTLPA